MENIGLNDLMVAIKEVGNDVIEMKTDIAVLKTDVAELKTDVAVLKTDVAELKTDVASLKEEQFEIKNDMNTGFRKLERKFNVLTRDMIEARADINFLEENMTN